MRPLVVVVALLLAGPLSGAVVSSSANYWDDVAGGPQRTGAAFLPTATLDVLETRDLEFPAGQEMRLTRAKGLVETPHGLIGLAYDDDDACIHLVITDSTVESSVLGDCEGGKMEGYDRANDRLFVCSEGGPTEPIFQSRDALSGEIAWAIRPDQLNLEGSADVTWDCQGGTLDSTQGVVYVIVWAITGTCVSEAFTAVCTPTPQAALVRAQAADGSLDWVTPISAHSFYANFEPSLEGNQPYQNQGPGYAPQGISLLDGGVVVSGRNWCACGKGTGVLPSVSNFQASVAWFHASDGDMVGRTMAEDSQVDEGFGSRYHGAWWTPTQGPLSAFVLGDRLMVINGDETAPIRQATFQSIETARGFIGVLPSSWWDDTLLVTLGESVTAVDTQTLDSIWSWTKGGDRRVSAMLVIPPSDVWVLLVEDLGPNGPAPATLHRLDLATGDEVQTLAVPGPILNDGGLGQAHFQPLSDGRVLIHTAQGHLFTLGTPNPADAPQLVVSNQYPALLNPVTIAVDDPDPDTQYSIAWGDNGLESGGTSWTNRYGASEDFTVRVTATFTDGRTATAEYVIHSGQPAPPELNLLQQAFADENQDLTFGIIGIAVTLFGALLALILRRRRHGYLQSELDRLHIISQASRNDPTAAAMELSTFRSDMEAKLSAHQLSDGQYSLLETRASSVSGVIRHRILGPIASKLTQNFHHAMDLVMFDGRIDAGEVKQLVKSLDAEKQLTGGDRNKLRKALAGLAKA